MNMFFFRHSAWFITTSLASEKTDQTIFFFNTTFLIAFGAISCIQDQIFTENRHIICILRPTETGSRAPASPATTKKLTRCGVKALHTLNLKTNSTQLPTEPSVEIHTLNLKTNSTQLPTEPSVEMPLNMPKHFRFLCILAIRRCI